MTRNTIAIVRDPTPSRPSPLPSRRPRILALSALDTDLSKLVALQKQAERIDLQARQLRASIQDGMAYAKLSSYQTPQGIRASLFSLCRFNVDRAKLKKLLTSRQLAAVLKPVTSTVLRVR
jgi:hypothetical protein